MPSFTSFFSLPNNSIIENGSLKWKPSTLTLTFNSVLIGQLEFFAPLNRMILPSISRNRNINRSNRVIIGMQMSSTDRQSLVVGSSIIIVVSRLLSWLTIFRLEDRTNDEYTRITWRCQVISITLDPQKEAGRMAVRHSIPRISRISVALEKLIRYENWIQTHQ